MTSNRLDDSSGQGESAEVQKILSALGHRPRKAKLREAIYKLTRLRPWRPVELADVLDFNPSKLVERHLRDMVDEGLLERTHPENLAHPGQAYRAVPHTDKGDVPGDSEPPAST